MKCAEVVPNLKEKELLELDGKNLQIRQVGVNGDPPDPMLAGARYEIVELLLAVYDVS